MTQSRSNNTVGNFSWDSSAAYTYILQIEYTTTPFKYAWFSAVRKRWRTLSIKLTLFQFDIILFVYIVFVYTYNMRHIFLPKNVFRFR